MEPYEFFSRALSMVGVLPFQKRTKANKTEQKRFVLIPFPNMVFGFGMNS